MKKKLTTWILRKIVQINSKDPEKERELILSFLDTLIPKSYDISDKSMEYAKDCWKRYYGNKPYDYTAYTHILGKEYINLNFARIQFCFIDGYVQGLADMGYILEDGKAIKEIIFTLKK